MLQDLVAQDLNLDSDKITVHFAAISVLHSQIMVSSATTTNETINERIIGILIDKLQEAYSYDPNSKATLLWHSAATRWSKDFENDPSKVPFYTLKISVAKQLSCVAKAQASYGQSNKRQLLNPSVPAGVAFTADEVYDIAFQAACYNTAFAARPMEQNGACWNCGSVISKPR
eukprot:903560-Rhodomonas_salina.1